MSGEAMGSVRRLAIRTTAWALLPSLVFSFVNATYLEDGLSEPLADLFFVMTPLMLAIWVAAGIWAVTGRAPRLPHLAMTILKRRRVQSPPLP